MLRHIIVENVRHAFAELPSTFEESRPEESRNGMVLVMPGPLVTSYRRPEQRVLLDPLRDANPFFHLMEAFWMLAGRNDVASLMRYNAGMRKYSDDGETFHGAYGHRWRQHFRDSMPIDQIAEIVDMLRANPHERRIVLQMWDPEVDLNADGLDFPCNNLCYFRVRRVHVAQCDLEAGVSPLKLDMTISCRSNDMLWGGYGANAVHFSVLQEFVASMIGARVGEMHQLSNNAHLYHETAPDLSAILPYTGYTEPVTPLFGDLSRAPFQLVSDELDAIWDDKIGAAEHCEYIPASTLQLIAGMERAWEGWKLRDWGMFTEGTGLIPHEDWHRACVEWGDRRRERFQ